MIFQPAVIVLLLTSLLTASMVLYASFYGIRIIRRWDITSGSEGQLELERRTYLISMILSYTLTFEIGSLFLYIFTADSLHSLFVGAMCAAGSLNANPYGYPALLLKILTTILAGLWLIINFTDNRAYDYPLIKTKYVMLLILAPLVLIESMFETAYFTHLKGNVITSCCGSLFSDARQGVASDLAAVPVRFTVPAFFLSLGLTFGLGITYRVKEKLGVLFSAASTASFPVLVISLISFIGLYFYELPTHHCPFCILQREYGYIGYLLYATLLAGVVAGLGVGALMPFAKIRSLSKSIPVVQKRLTLVCLVAYLLFAVISVRQMIFSNLSVGAVRQMIPWP
jgi:hypothetical protein